MRVPFGSLPSMSSLFLDYVNDEPRLRNFYPQPYSVESVAAFARQRPTLDASHRDRLCGALVGDPVSIKKLANGATAVITGQQPGLFTGPHYTILKAVTVIKLAKALDAMGVPAVPVFWVAAEDHDYEEIESASIVDRDSGLLHTRVDLSNPDSSPVGWLTLHDDVTDSIAKLFEALPDSEFRTEIREVLESTYKPGVSPVEAFVKMLALLWVSR